MRHVLMGLVFLFTVQSAPSREALTDHPLIKPYEGSVIRRKDVKAFDEYRLITGSDQKTFSGPRLEGRVTKLLYANPKNRSLLEMVKNYQDALERGGATILFTCNQNEHECMKAYAGPEFQKYSGIHGISNLDGRFVSARIEHKDQTAFIAIAVGRSFTDVHVIEVKKMETGKASVDATALGEGIDRDGFVVVEHIFFDTDKTTVKAESGPALDQIAKLLAARPALQLYVVGHTDMQGSLAHNMELSRGRANAVVAALVGDHKIAAARLEGHGIGPLAPQSSNATDSGRSLNRRVVLVAR